MWPETGPSMSGSRCDVRGLETVPYAAAAVCQAAPHHLAQCQSWHDCQAQPQRTSVIHMRGSILLLDPTVRPRRYWWQTSPHDITLGECVCVRSPLLLNPGAKPYCPTPGAAGGGPARHHAGRAHAGGRPRRRLCAGRALVLPPAVPIADYVRTACSCCAP